MDQTQAIRHFNWWFGQADYCLLLTAKKPWSTNSRYIVLCCLQHAAEFTFKSVIDSLTGRQVRSRDPYTLLKLAALQIPAIQQVFPRNTPFEKKLFHYLKPVFILMRGDAGLLPGDQEMEMLVTRIKELHSIVKTTCMTKIHEM